MADSSTRKTRRIFVTHEMFLFSTITKGHPWEYLWRLSDENTELITSRSIYDDVHKRFFQLFYNKITDLINNEDSEPDIKEDFISNILKKFDDLYQYLTILFDCTTIEDVLYGNPASTTMVVHDAIKCEATHLVSTGTLPENRDFINFFNKRVKDNHPSRKSYTGVFVLHPNDFYRKESRDPTINTEVISI